MTILVFMYGMMIGLNGMLGRWIYKYSEDSLQQFNSRIKLFFIMYMVFESLIIILALALFGIGFQHIFQTFENTNSFTNIEHLYAFIFNSFFFTSQIGDSNQTQVSKFWKWIANNCPHSISENLCIKAYSFSPSNCAADYSTCVQQNGNGFACPYNICRSEVRSFATQCMLYICSGGIFIVLIQISLLVSFPLYVKARDEMISISKIAILKRSNSAVLPILPTEDSGESTHDANDVERGMPCNVPSTEEDAPACLHETVKENILDDHEFVNV